jgi:hypothetical protein
LPSPNAASTATRLASGSDSAASGAELAHVPLDQVDGGQQQVHRLAPSITTTRLRAALSALSAAWAIFTRLVRQENEALPLMVCSARKTWLSSSGSPGRLLERHQVDSSRRAARPTR